MMRTVRYLIGTLTVFVALFGTLLIGSATADAATSRNYKIPACYRVFSDPEDVKAYEEYRTKLKTDEGRQELKDDADNYHGRFDDCLARTNVDAFTGEGSNATSGSSDAYWNDPLQPGRFPTDNYDVGYGGGFSATNPIGSAATSIMGSVLKILWSLNIVLVEIALWFVKFAYKFPMLDTLSDWAGQFARNYESFYIARLNVRYWAIAATLLYAGFHIMRGRMGKAIGEIFTTMFVFALMIVMLAFHGGPAGILKEGFAITGSIAGSTLSMGFDATTDNRSSPHGDWWVQGMDYRDNNQWRQYIEQKCTAAKQIAGARDAEHDRKLQAGRNDLNIQPDPDAARAVIDDRVSSYFSNYKKNIDVMLCPIRAQIHGTFVEEPNELVNWGRNLGGISTGEDKGSIFCAQIRDNALATGPWDTDSWPREAMAGHKKDGKPLTEGHTLSNEDHEDVWTGTTPNADAGGCMYNRLGDKLDRYNSEPTPARFMYVLMTLIATISVVVLLIMLSFGVVGAVASAALLMAFSPIAISGGLLPGTGREIFIRWITALTKSFMAVIGVATFLTTYVLAIHTVLTTTRNVSMLERFAVLMTMIVVFFLFRKKFREGVGKLSLGAGNMMSGANAGIGSGGRGGGGGQGAGFASSFANQQPDASNMVSIQRMRAGKDSFMQGTGIGRSMQKAQQRDFSARSFEDQKANAKSQLKMIDRKLKDPTKFGIKEGSYEMGLLEDQQKAYRKVAKTKNIGGKYNPLTSRHESAQRRELMDANEAMSSHASHSQYQMHAEQLAAINNLAKPKKKKKKKDK